MNPDEKLTALKKAYADIILNTAKEAAARIMASERKSVRLQHELNASKEQAVQMLLRLKQMADYKIREAETNSLSKQKKIEELEAQLHEAEDIVKELRDELRGAQDELERVKKSQFKEKKPEVTSSATVYMERSALDQINEAYNTYQDDNDGIVEPEALPIQENILNFESENVVDPVTAPIQEGVNSVELQDEVNNGHQENIVFNAANSYVSKPNLPSIILGSKGTEPYRNKRTQRIRAFEEKLMAGELTFSDTTREVKNDANGKENGNDEEINKKSGLGGRRKKDAVQKSESLKRRRYTKNKKNTIFPSGHDQALDGNRRSDISHGELTLADKDVEVDENPLDLGRRKKDAVHKPESFKRKRYTKNKKNTIFPSGHDQALVGDRRSDISHGDLTLDDKDVEVDENPLDLLSRLSEDIHHKRTLLKCTKVSENGVFSETNDFQSGCADVDKGDVVAGTDCELSKQSVTFKYTFQRRKKKGLSNSGTNSSVENEIVKDLEMEKGNDVMETGISASVAESSRDSRRMAQVARQLIALSEIKWWK